MRWVALLLCLVCGSARADWEVKRNPFDPVVIARYKQLLAQNPHDGDALRRLTALYKSYSKVATLEAEYKAALDKAPGDWATLVVLARLAQADRTAAVALWNRALQVRADDGKGWLALGDLTLDAKSARGAFQHAVVLAKTPKDKQAALIKLIGAARSANDPKTIDTAYAELVAMSPKDGQLWFDRGSAQLTANWAEPARDSFVHAVELLKPDPERRLTAMMYVGIALEKMGKVDDAIAQWEKTLDQTPPTSYSRRDLVPRIVEAERKRHALASAIARLEKRWPERSRAHYEWDVLGDLYADSGRVFVAIAAYRRAVTIAPTEIETQRKLIKLLDQVSPSEALAQHEIAAKVAPGDANLQIDLAKRYHETEPVKALQTLDRLAKRLAGNAGARLAMAELYTSWEETSRALIEYEAVANIEPNEMEHAITLGNEYWRSGAKEQAVIAWHRLAKIKTAAAALREGDIMISHSVWADAAQAYTRAIELDPTNPEAWRGRARAHDELGQASDAVSDARRAVALIGKANAADGDRARFQLVRSLARASGYRDDDGRRWNRRSRHSGSINANAGTELGDNLARWRFAFDHGDIAAGYLLAAHHGRVRDPQLHDTLLALYRKVPDDDAVGVALARSYSSRNDFVHARAELERIAKRSPKRSDEIKLLIEQVELDKLHAADEAFRREEGLSRNDRKAEDLVGKPHRLGIRSGVGGDLRGTSGAMIDLGVYHSQHMGGRKSGGGFEIRFDWQRHDDYLDKRDEFALAGELNKRLWGAPRFELAAGIGPRISFRYGGDPETSQWGRAAIAGDASIMVLPRALPAVLGLRLEQQLTDRDRGTSMLVELGFEVR